MSSKRDHVLLIGVLAAGVLGAGSWFFLGGSRTSDTSAADNQPAERRERTEVVETSKATRPPRERSDPTVKSSTRRPPRTEEQTGTTRRPRVRDDQKAPKRKPLPTMG